MAGSKLDDARANVADMDREIARLNDEGTTARDRRKARWLQRRRDAYAWAFTDDAGAGVYYRAARIRGGSGTAAAGRPTLGRATVDLGKLVDRSARSMANNDSQLEKLVLRQLQSAAGADGWADHDMGRLHSDLERRLGTEVGTARVQATVDRLAAAGTIDVTADTNAGSSRVRVRQHATT